MADSLMQDLLEGAKVARLASISRSGRPHVNPNYFVIEGSRLWLGTTTGTLAARNVAANPSVQLLLEIERDPSDLRLVRITGNATIRTEPDLLKEYKRRDARKYFLSLRGLLMSLRHLHRLFLTSKYLFTTDPTSRHCVIEVEPTRFEILESGTSRFPRARSGPAIRRPRLRGWRRAGPSTRSSCCLTILLR
jgi:general stress protein 26